MTIRSSCKIQFWVSLTIEHTNKLCKNTFLLNTSGEKIRCLSSGRPRLAAGQVFCCCRG